MSIQKETSSTSSFPLLSLNFFLSYPFNSFLSIFIRISATSIFNFPAKKISSRDKTFRSELEKNFHQKKTFLTFGEKQIKKRTLFHFFDSKFGLGT